jgi:endogenous inhibitor of DNA gyrase (YacG/DUF329 family)
VTRNNVPIQEYPLSAEGGVQTGIGYGLLFQQCQACVDSGLDLDRWLNGQYTVQTMVYTVAYYRVKKLVEAHSSDAEQLAMKAKKRG